MKLPPIFIQEKKSEKPFKFAKIGLLKTWAWESGYTHGRVET